MNKLKNSNSGHYTLFFLVFFSLYGPRLKVVDLMALITTLLAISCVFKIIIEKKIEKFSLILIFYLSFLFLFSCLHFYISGKGDFTGLGLVVKQLIYLLCAYYIVDFAYSRYNTEAKDKIYKVIVFSTALNGLAVILFFLFPSLSGFASNYLDYTRQLNWLDTGHRMFDLSLGGGASASFVFSLVFLLGLYLTYKEFNKYILISLIIICISTLMMGRTGLYLIFLCTIIFLFINLRYRGANIFKLFLCVGFIFLFGLLCSKLGLISFDFTRFSDLIGWAFEVFINYFDSGVLESGTTNAIGNMWFYPSDVEHFMYGDGNFGREDNLPFIPSDIGYVRAVFGYGILGATLLLALYLFVSVTPYFISRKSANIDTFLPLLIVLLILLMNSKEFHYAARGSGLMLFIVYLTTVFQIRQKNET